MNRRGFTAMELTVVLLMISVAMLLVNHANHAARDRAGDTSCMSNLKQIGLGLLMYAADHDLHMPPDRGDLRPLSPYVNNYALFRCPEAPRRAEEDENYPWGGEDQSHPVDYVFNPSLIADDLPTAMLAADNVADRHRGKRWNGVRLDGAAGRYPADQWSERIGWVSQHDQTE